MIVPLNEVVHFDAICHSPTTNAVSDADSTPTWAVYEEDTDTAIVSGNFTKRTSLTGDYRGSFTASNANGFDVGKFYNVIASATVGGVAGKAVVKSFRCVAANIEHSAADVLAAFSGKVGAIPNDWTEPLNCFLSVDSCWLYPSTGGTYIVPRADTNNFSSAASGYSVVIQDSSIQIADVAGNTWSVLADVSDMTGESALQVPHVSGPNPEITYVGIRMNWVAGKTGLPTALETAAATLAAFAGKLGAVANDGSEPVSLGYLHLTSTDSGDVFEITDEDGTIGVDGLLKTIAAILARLPDFPAAVGSTMTLTSDYNAAKTAAQETTAQAIKAKTDNLPSDPADESDLEAKLDEIIAQTGPTPGAIETTLVVKSSGQPVQGVQVWVTTDSAGENIVAGASSTDVDGKVVFYLEAGTYYRFAYKPGYTFTNPSSFVVTA